MKIECSGVTLLCGVGGDDDLFETALTNPSYQTTDTQLLRPDAIEWGESSMKYMIQTTIRPGSLEGQDILRLFYDTHLIPVTGGVGADGTGVLFGIASTNRTVVDHILNGSDLTSKLTVRLGIGLDQVVGDPGSTACTDPR